MSSSQAATRATTPSSLAAPQVAGPPAQHAVEELLELSQVDLYQLFRRSSPGEIPVGRGRGTPIFLPGTFATSPAAGVFGTVAWRGKVFRPESGDLKNLISPLGIPLFRARVYREDSWFDGQECIVLDYSQTSFAVGWVRDEIREVSTGLYLGLVYGLGRLFGGRRLLDVTFALDFRPASGSGQR